MNFDDNFFNFIKHCIALICFIYLVRNAFTAIQCLKFFSNLKSLLFAKPLKKKEGDIDETISVLSLDKIVNGFGFNFKPETIDIMINSKNHQIVYFIVIALQAIVLALVAHYLLGVSIAFIAFAYSSLVFLLLII